MGGEGRKHKYKGTTEHHRRQGLGRLRRASAKTGDAADNLVNRIDDEQWQERQGSHTRMSHTGASLLAKFNRLARDTAQGTGALGTVVGFEGLQIAVHLDHNGQRVLCDIRSALTKQLSGVRNPLCAGDRVRVQGLEDGGSPVLCALLPRRTQVLRADSHNKALLQAIAANVDVLVIVASLGVPELRPALIDRYILLAHLDDIEPIVVINKADLGDSQAVLALYRSLGYRTEATIASATHTQLGDLPRWLAGRSCVFAGQSGVGKSSLVRALFPGLDIRIGAVSTMQMKGRHTTTAACAYALEQGGMFIDTPGVRECGIPQLGALDLALRYREFASRQSQCRFPDCTHTHEPDCAVKLALEAGHIARSRYESYCAILEEDLA